MNKLIWIGLTGLLMAENGFADNTEMTIINESAVRANIIFQAAQTKIVSIEKGINMKMFNTDYKYPTQILIQTQGSIPKPCNWTVPPVGAGKQPVSYITMNISLDKSTNKPSCLLSWQ